MRDVLFASVFLQLANSENALFFIQNNREKDHLHNGRKNLNSYAYRVTRILEFVFKANLVYKLYVKIWVTVYIHTRNASSCKQLVRDRKGTLVQILTLAPS